MSWAFCEQILCDHEYPYEKKYWLHANGKYISESCFYHQQKRPVVISVSLAGCTAKPCTAKPNVNSTFTEVGRSLTLIK